MGGISHASSVYRVGSDIDWRGENTQLLVSVVFPLVADGAGSASRLTPEVTIQEMPRRTLNPTHGMTKREVRHVFISFDIEGILDSA